MQVKTFTTFWNQEKKLYAINDWTLPFAISLRVAGVFILIALPWWIIMGVTGVPFAPPIGYLVWLAPPIGIAYLGSRPIFEGKTLFQYAFSRLMFFGQRKVYSGTRPSEQASLQKIVYKGSVYSKID